MSAKILVADDDLPFIEVLTSRLNKAGYEVCSVCEGVRVMEVAKRERPDLIVLDLKMPAGGGMDVLKRIKKDPILGSIPVVIVTGTFPQLGKESLEKGAAAFFTKPYEPDQLLQTIRKLLEP